MVGPLISTDSSDLDSLWFWLLKQLRKQCDG